MYQTGEAYETHPDDSASRDAPKGPAAILEGRLRSDAASQDRTSRNFGPTHAPSRAVLATAAPSAAIRASLARIRPNGAGLLRLCGVGLAELSEDERSLLTRLPPNPLDAIISALGVADGGSEALSVLLSLSQLQ